MTKSWQIGLDLTIYMNDRNRAYLYLHSAIFLWGFTAILGDLISLNAYWLVWWRVLITSVTIACIPTIIVQVFKIPKQLIRRYIIIGVLISIHWLTFFGAIKYANASVALVAFSTTALFTSFLEPWFTQKRIQIIDVIFGLAVIPGMFLVVSDLRGDMLLGLGVGLISAFLAALFAVLNKKYIDHADPRVITFIELGSAWLFLTILIPIANYYGNLGPLWPSSLDWIYLFILSFVCTTFAFIIHLKALKYISAFVSNLVVNLEPVYGIILAALILQDYNELNQSFYIGVLMIIACLILYPVVKKKWIG